MTTRFGQDDVIDGRYQLHQHIASGGMGEVWQAEDLVLTRTVAVKILTKGLANTQGFDERFRSEARHAAQLHHHNIAAVHDFGEDSEGAWLVMEYVPGLTVAQMIRDRGPLPAEEVSDLLTQAARALGAAHHAGVVHRDVKPANVIVTPGGVAKLTDFGIARAVDAAGLTRTGEVMGTAQYLAPEQLMGKGATPASDLYSLGVVAHEMLTGERPYERESVVATAMAHVNEAVPTLPTGTPAPLAQVVLHLMAKDPDQRPRNAAEVVQMVTRPETFVAKRPTPMPATAPVTAPVRPPKRRTVATTQGHPVIGSVPHRTSSTAGDAAAVPRGAGSAGVGGDPGPHGARDPRLVRPAQGSKARSGPPERGGTGQAGGRGNRGDGGRGGPGGGTGGGSRPRPRRFPWAWFAVILVIAGLLTALATVLMNLPDGAAENPDERDNPPPISESSSSPSFSGATDPTSLDPTTETTTDPAPSEPTSPDPTQPTTTDPPVAPTTPIIDPTTPAPTIPSPEPTTPAVPTATEPSTEPGPDPSQSSASPVPTTPPSDPTADPTRPQPTSPTPTPSETSDSEPSPSEDSSSPTLEAPSPSLPSEPDPSLTTEPGPR